MIFMTHIPSDQHITYQLQYRKCGKDSCRTCRSRQGHGPYWYAYWREDTRLCSGYIGKVHPDVLGAPIHQSNMRTPHVLTPHASTPVLV